MQPDKDLKFVFSNTLLVHSNLNRYNEALGVTTQLLTGFNLMHLKVEPFSSDLILVFRVHCKSKIIMQ